MIKIGTRGSPLAVRQADGAAHKLVQPYELEIIKSQGDIDQKTPIYEMGGKHVFCSALEESLLAGKVDCCIHSAKDMATELHEDTEVMGVVWEVGDRRDTLVGPFENFDSIPKGQRIGTSSPRRAKMLQDQRSDLRHVLRRRLYLCHHLRKALNLLTAGLSLATHLFTLPAGAR